MVELLDRIEPKRSNALVRALLGSQVYDDRILPRFLPVLQALPIYRYIRRRGNSNFSEPIELRNSVIEDRFESSIVQLHADLQNTVVEMIIEINDGEARFDQAQTYRIPYLLSQYQGLRDNKIVISTDVRKDMMVLDSSFEPKLHIYNSLVSSSNIAHQLYNSKVAKERLSKNLGDDYNPDNNFHGMEYISPSNPNRIETMRDIAVFFGAIYRSGYQFKFDGTRIRRRSDIIDLFKDEDSVYYLYPCTRCRKGYTIKSGTIDSEFNHISDPIYGTDVRVNALIAEIQSIVNEGSPFAFLPKALNYITS